MCTFLKLWKKQVRSVGINRLLRLYWKVFFKLERRQFGHRGERLCLLKKLIKRKLPRRILPSKIWFYAVEKKKIFNPFLFEDDEKYIETLMLWKKREMKNFIAKHPILLVKGYRHEKVCEYKRPLRV